MTLARRSNWTDWSTASSTELAQIVGARADPHLARPTATTGPACPPRSRCTGGPSGCPTSWCCRPRPSRSRAVVRIANELRIPVVPRDGGTGLTDGAVPLRGGIVLDVKRMNQIHELDLVNRTVTVGTGINMLKLNEGSRQHGLSIPTTRRPTRARWSAAGSAPAAGR